MGEFYLLRTDSDPKILGVKNGGKQASIKRSGYTEPQKYDELIRVIGTNYYWENKHEFLDFDFDIQCVEMLPQANMTNFLHFGPYLRDCPFLISQKLFEVISKKNICSHRFFPATVIDTDSEYKFMMLLIQDLEHQVVDFSKSTYRSPFDVAENNFFSFHSNEEKERFAIQNSGLIGDSIYLNHFFDKSLDLFSLQDVGLVVSRNLKTELEMLGLVSGVKFLPAFGDVAWPKIKIL